jgi:hypothetical protein
MSLPKAFTFPSSLSLSSLSEWQIQSAYVLCKLTEERGEDKQNDSTKNVTILQHIPLQTQLTQKVRTLQKKTDNFSIFICLTWVRGGGEEA